MALYHFKCIDCGRIFEDASRYDEDKEIVIGVACECGSMGERIWLKAPAARFDSPDSMPMEMRNAARIQLGREFQSRKEHDDYCRDNGYEPISAKEFEQVAMSRPETKVPIQEQFAPDLDKRIHERLEANYHKLINGELPPQPAMPADTLAEIKATAEKINKQMETVA